MIVLKRHELVLQQLPLMVFISTPPIPKSDLVSSPDICI
jgi:hypothetical protein